MHSLSIVPILWSKVALTSSLEWKQASSWRMWSGTRLRVSRTLHPRGLRLTIEPLAMQGRPILLTRSIYYRLALDTIAERVLVSRCWAHKQDACVTWHSLLTSENRCCMNMALTYIRKLASNLPKLRTQGPLASSRISKMGTKSSTLTRTKYQHSWTSKIKSQSVRQYWASNLKNSWVIWLSPVLRKSQTKTWSLQL